MSSGLSSAPIQISVARLAYFGAQRVNNFLLIFVFCHAETLGYTAAIRDHYIKT
jgi:hypothetical protein